MDVENMDVFVERIRWSGIPAILAAVHLSDTFLSSGFIDNLRAAHAALVVLRYSVNF
ncbi:hypothetical protein [Reinekea marinisedimentorum]|uniref:Uncharacterized protein n=1 Tax=Reinekea marinisedimentorum TaxID=230495 RepID=A0A4R3I0Q3_9GAMM|nr:hypothetical protein [Reinekea marinisedimentorum]TCS38764.1 hypothetical protein BCF53_11538 [Reinekea marinisedimentorum]